MVIIAVRQSQTIDRSWLYAATAHAKKNAIFIANAASIQQDIDLWNVVNKCQVGINFEDSHAH